jgi:hypothetical protein
MEVLKQLSGFSSKRGYKEELLRLAVSEHIQAPLSTTCPPVSAHTLGACLQQQLEGLCRLLQPYPTLQQQALDVPSIRTLGHDSRSSGILCSAASSSAWSTRPHITPQVADASRNLEPTIPAYTRSRMRWICLRSRASSYWQIVYLFRKCKCTTRRGLEVCAREKGESFRICVRPTQLEGSQTY